MHFISHFVTYFTDNFFFYFYSFAFFAMFLCALIVIFPLLRFLVGGCDCYLLVRTATQPRNRVRYATLRCTISRHIMSHHITSSHQTSPPLLTLYIQLWFPYLTLLCASAFRIEIEWVVCWLIDKWSFLLNPILSYIISSCFVLFCAVPYDPVLSNPNLPHLTLSSPNHSDEEEMRDYEAKWETFVARCNGIRAGDLSM